MVAYQTRRGARVVNVGSMHWAHALDPWVGRAAFRQRGGERDCLRGDGDGFSRASSAAAQVTANILNDLGAVPATPTHDLVASAPQAWP